LDQKFKLRHYHLPQYHIYLKLFIEGIPSPGFSAVTLPLQGEKTGNAAQVIALSRTRYGHPALTTNTPAVTQPLLPLG
jgi:hypothetical protein